MSRTEQTPAPLVKCPHCKAEMPTVNLSSWVMDAPVAVLAISCPSCNTVLQMIPTAAPPQAGQQKSGLIS